MYPKLYYYISYISYLIVLSRYAVRRRIIITPFESAPHETKTFQTWNAQNSPDKSRRSKVPRQVEPKRAAESGRN